MQFQFVILTALIYNAQCDCKVKKLVEGIETLVEQVSTYEFPHASSFECSIRDPDEVISFGHFHFIISGAGTAGSLLASRLAENSSWNILLLESGERENDVSQVPDMAKYLQRSDFTWGYRTTSQKFGLNGYIDSSIPIGAGKSIGGSSSVDNMAFIRGNKADFDNWGYSNPGWSYAHLLPLFKKIENVTFEHPDLRFRGTEGELEIDYSRAFDCVGNSFLKSCAKRGLPSIQDYNAKHQIGASKLQFIQNNGKRASSATSFLKRVENYPNIKILSKCFITKVLIDEHTKKTIGVEFLKNGILRNATASKEVILSMGAINTPKILMLSGIGPEDHLKHFNIPVIKNLPVGNNLWDQLTYQYQTFKINKTIENEDLEAKVEQYLTNGTGSLTAPNGLQAVAFANLLGPRCDKSIPDVQYLLRSSVDPEEEYEVFKKLIRATHDTYEHIILPTLGIFKFAIDIISLNPNSRGTVRLQSNSYLNDAVIDPNYFSDPKDVDIFVEAIEETFKIGEAEPFHKFDSKFISVIHPNCQGYKCNTQSFWKCMVLNLAKTSNSFSGTAKMGSCSDPEAVVDNNLKVHGIEGLRIVDSSVIPEPLSGPSSAVTFVIAEKASQLIYREYC